MKLTFLGTGTSQGIPVVGCHCAACSSTDSKDKRLRVAVKIEVANRTLIIDIGPDFRQQMLRTQTERVDGILITHEHMDHIAGLDDIRPFNFKHDMDMPVYAKQSVLDFLRQRHPYIFEATYPGVPRVNLHPIDKDTPMVVAGVPVQPIEIYHGTLPILGFRIGGLAYLTDFKTIEDSELHKLENLEVLVVSALHHQAHHSHSTLEESVAFAREIGAQRTFLTHMSHRMGTHAATEKQLPNDIDISLAYDGLEVEL